MTSQDKRLRPMLAESATKEQVKLPCWVTPKIDGIRCRHTEGLPLSRKAIALPNKFIQGYFKGSMHLHGLDGELVVGQPNASDCFNKSTSAFMSFEGQPDFTYWVFDDFTIPNDPYEKRIKRASEKIAKHGDPRVRLLEWIWVETYDELCAIEEMHLSLGFEGLVTRAPEAPYKNGRSTLKQQWMLKVKAFEDSEAKIVGFVERMHNANELTTDDQGYAKRSTHQANKVPMDTLGAFVVRDLKHGWLFEIGTGMDDDLRQLVWNNREEYMLKIVKYQYFKQGMKDKPRFPSFKGFRDPMDMD